MVPDTISRKALLDALEKRGAPRDIRELVKNARPVSMRDGVETMRRIRAILAIGADDPRLDAEKLAHIKRIAKA